MAAAEGDIARLERVLGRVFQEGESPVSVIRAVLRHLHRLHALAALVSAGAPAGEALRSARPPIFYKYEDSFKRQLGLWSEARLRPELDRIAQAEINMKTTGLPSRDPVPAGDAGAGAGRARRLTISPAVSSRPNRTTRGP